jgi:hypothetical protein
MKAGPNHALKTGQVLHLDCVVCGRPFAHRVRNGRRPLCCPRAECRTARASALRRQSCADGRARPRRPIEKICEICQRPFTTTDARTRCCGQRCGGVLSKRNELATRARAAELKALPLFAADVPARFLEDLRRRMALAGLSGQALSIAAGLGVSTVTNILGERRRPRPETLDALASALGCTVAELTGGAANARR